MRGACCFGDKSIAANPETPLSLATCSAFCWGFLMSRMLCNEKHCTINIVQPLPAAVIAGAVSLIVLFFYGQAADWNYKAALAFMMKYKPAGGSLELDMLRQFGPQHWLTVGGLVGLLNALVNSVFLRHRRYAYLLLSSFGLPGTMLSGMWIAAAIAFGSW